MKKQTPEYDCCWDELDKAKHVGRAHWVCINCGKDVSLQYVLLMQCFESVSKPSVENEKLEGWGKKIPKSDDFFKALDENKNVDIPAIIEQESLSSTNPYSKPHPPHLSILIRGTPPA